MQAMADYRIEELLAVTVSRELKDGELGVIGLGTGGRSFAFAVGVPSVANRARAPARSGLQRTVRSRVGAGH